MKKRPNILLISLDNVRADHLSCYGYHKKTTPNIDMIASEGTNFRQNYSTGVWTPPAHASMLTGLYVSEHGVYGDRRLDDNIPTIATVLKENGYQTAGFVNNSQVGELVGLHKGHDTFFEVWRGVKPTSMIERIFKAGIRKIRKALGYSDMGATRTNKLFKNWLESKLNTERSFYAFLHYIEPHNPFHPPRPYKNKFSKNKMTKRIDRKKIKKIVQNPLVIFVEDLTLNENEIDLVKTLYDAEIAYTDSKVGEMVGMLKENSLYDNTMIIITSDHGEHFGEHNLWSHVSSLYNEVLKVPLIIKFPEGVKNIKQVDQYTQLVDIFPTVMDIAGISGKKVKNKSGISLVYNSSGNKFHEYIFAEWEGRVPYFIQNSLERSKPSLDINKFTNEKWMIMNGNYKYILASDGQEELYNLTNDRRELNNLIDKNQEIAAIMKMKLSKWRSETNKKISKEQRILDDVIKNNLRALGYM